MATLLQPRPLQPAAINGGDSAIILGAAGSAVPRPEDLTLLQQGVARERARHEQSRRDRFRRLLRRHPNVRDPPQRAPPPVPSGGIVQPRHSTAADSGVDAGTATPVTTSVSAASRETRRSALRKERQQAQTTVGESSTTQPEAPKVSVGGIPVEVRLGILDRLRTLELASSLGLTADRMANFTESEQRKLTQFQREFNRVRIDWFRGRPTPNVRFELVALTKDGATAQGRYVGTSICIRGLQTDDDIREFHRVMSRDFVQRLYKPLRLSYDTSLIRAAAREINETYDYQPSSLGETLCGTTIFTTADGLPGLISTVGGIVSAGGHLYAITTSHRPEQESQLGNTSPASTSGDATLFEGDYDLDVESPLVLDDLPKTEPSDSPTEKASVPTHFWAPLSIDPTRRALEGDDWRLAPISGVHCLPNAVPNNMSILSQSTAVFINRYITDYVKSPRRMAVHILGGFTGVSTGTLLSSPSYLSIHGGPAEEVWTVISTLPTLTEGDSGSWVVDDNRLLVGMVRAFSGNQVYLAPFSIQRQQIVSELPELTSVMLPSPLQCWLEVASAARGSSPELANKFASKALSLAVLNASADIDPLARTLQSARLTFGASPLDMKQLEDLLSREGNNLRNSLNEKPRLSPPGDTYISDIHRRLKDIHSSLRSTDVMVHDRPMRLRREGGPSGSPPVPGISEQQPEQKAEPTKNEPNEAGGLPLPFNEKDEKQRFSLAKFSVSIITLVGMSAIAGIAAGSISSTPLGPRAAIGATLAAPIVAWEVLSIRDWLPSILVPRIPTYLIRSESSTMRGLSVASLVVGTILSLAVVFMRPFIALEVASRVLDSGDTMRANMGVLRIAATAAAAPLLGDSLANNLKGYAEHIDSRNRKPRLSLESMAMTAGLYVYLTGWDALAGYTFARVARNWGVDIASDSSAAAAGAIFGAVALPWSFLSTIVGFIFEVLFGTLVCRYCWRVSDR
ncbi:hypothetical protein B0T16DRAFT_447897 [Cercophora newfieldiana]|uniref:Uncharacterized protein n=1 Tax=Cercophora newfieldiana TaxID=92897 RepID=A0AA39Y1F6_9PEZI|nr:hypothetical protein B0T16DRAFT_447897 [Cercophora newfieldiana]